MLPLHINGFPIGNGLVDTGSTVTILPMELHGVLGVDLNYDKKIVMHTAGGGTLIAIPSYKKVAYSIDQSGFRSIQWNGILYFSALQKTTLIGHYECLDQLVLTLDGPRRKLRVEKK